MAGLAYYGQLGLDIFMAKIGPIIYELFTREFLRISGSMHALMALHLKNQTNVQEDKQTELFVHDINISLTIFNRISQFKFTKSMFFF